MMLAFLVASAISGAHAEKPEMDAPIPAPAVQFLSTEDYNEKMKEAKLRAPAAAENDSVDYASAFSDSFKNLEAQIVGGAPWKSNHEDHSVQNYAGVHSAADMENLLKILEQNYTHLDTDAKFVGAQLIALHPWRGFIYRVRPLFESKSTFSHTAAIVLMRTMLAGINTYIPTKEWHAAFDYLTQPYPGVEQKMIRTEPQLYAFFRNEVMPKVNELAGRISNLSFRTPIYYDNKLLNSESNFASNSDRYVRLGEAERQAFLSGVEFSMSAIDFSIAYSWNGLLSTVDNYMAVMGINASLRVDNVTSQSRTNALRRNSQLFTLRQNKQAALELTTQSMNWYIDAVRYSKLAWQQLKHDSGNHSASANFFDPRAFVPFTRVIDATYANVESLTEDRGITSAVVAGDTLDIRFSTFFRDPPQDLKAFLPTHFKPNRDLTEPTTGLSYRDYDAGNPDGWNTAAYAKYFPSASSPNGVRHAARLLSQSWGGAIVGVPFSAAMF